MINRHRGIIYKVSALYGHDKEDRQDLFQEITLQCWRGFASFRGEARISTWIYRVALNTAITYFRKSKRQVPTRALYEGFPEVQDTGADTLENERLQMLYQAMNQLSDVEKSMMFLYLEARSYEEMASILGITQNNVRVKMNRARNKLKAIINPQ